MFMSLGHIIANPKPTKNRRIQLTVETKLSDFLNGEVTQDQLAKRLGLSQAAISRWLSSGRDIYIVKKGTKLTAFERRPLGKAV